MAHAVLIAVHALAATVALVAAALALWGRHRWVRALVPALVVMELGLVGAVVVGWSGSGRPLQLVFTALLVLGGVVVARGVEAARRGATGSRPDPARARSALAFVTIALVDAFLVVTVLDLGGPAWSLVATGVGVAVAGHVLLRRGAPQRRRRSASSERTSATSSASSIG